MKWRMRKLLYNTSHNPPNELHPIRFIIQETELNSIWNREECYFGSREIYGYRCINKIVFDFAA